MCRVWFILFLLLLVRSLNGQIILNDSTLNSSVAYKAEILEDPNHSISLDAMVRTDTFNFKSLKKPLEIIDFTRSR